jgi:hypothetical protein
MPPVVLFLPGDLLIFWLSAQLGIAAWHLLREEDGT